MRRCWKDMIEEITSSVRSGRMSAINSNPEGPTPSCCAFRSWQSISHWNCEVADRSSAIKFGGSQLSIFKYKSFKHFFLHLWIWLVKCVCSFANLTVFVRARNIGRMWTQKPIQPATFATLHWAAQAQNSMFELEYWIQTELESVGIRWVYVDFGNCGRSMWDSWDTKVPWATKPLPSCPRLLLCWRHHSVKKNVFPHSWIG